MYIASCVFYNDNFISMSDNLVELEAIKSPHSTFASLSDTIKDFMSKYSNIMTHLDTCRVNEISSCRLSFNNVKVLCFSIKLTIRIMLSLSNFLFQRHTYKKDNSISILKSPGKNSRTKKRFSMHHYRLIKGGVSIANKVSTLKQFIKPFIINVFNNLIIIYQNRIQFFSS